MSDKAGYHIGSGIAIAGFWIMIGLIYISSSFDDIKCVVEVIK